MQTLSKSEARKIVLLSQGLPSTSSRRGAYQKSVQAIERLGYVQIDTISVVQRAHDHTLWSRNSEYKPEHLTRMVKDKVAFEYWSHAASYLAMRDFRFSLPRKEAIKSDEQNHWFRKNESLMKDVLARITAEGPLMAKDFASNVTKKTGWESKPTKQALEMLYMQGDLMIAERTGFHKVYDLTERVLPDGIDTRIPSTEEHARFLIKRYLDAQGLGKLSEMIYLLKEVKKEVESSLNAMLEANEIELVGVGQERYFAQQSSLELLNKRLNRKPAKILSPFDNLVIQRERLKNLFDFDYLLECYVPAAKRQYGYFVLPILWDGKMVARADCKAHRKERYLEVIMLHREASLRKNADFEEALNEELARFTEFNQCDSFGFSDLGL